MINHPAPIDTATGFVEEILAKSSPADDLSPLGKSVLARVRSEITKPGSVVCLGQCVDMVKLLTDEDNPATVDEITLAILKDTFLTARVLTVANSAYYNRTGKAVSSVSQAILVLGLAQIRAIVFSVLVIEKLADQNQAGVIRNRTVLSAFCGAVSRGIADQLKIKIGEAAFLAGSFSQFGKLLVYSFLSDLTLKYDTAMAELGSNEFVVTEQIFGMRIEMLGKKIGEQLKLPPSLLAHMDPYEPFTSDSVNDKNLRQITRASFEICKVAERANDADEIQAKLAGSDIFRFGQFSTLNIGQLFHGSVEMIQDLYSAAANAPLFKKLTSLSAMIAPGTPIVPKPPEEPVQELDVDVFRQGVDIVGKQVGNLSTMRTILKSICDTLQKGFNAQNAAIAVITQSRDALVVEASGGPKSAYIEKNFAVSLNHNLPKITNVALLSGRDVYMENPASSKHVASIPLWILEVNPPSFLLIPIISEKSRYGLIYLDGPRLLGAQRIPANITPELEQLKNFAVWTLTQNGRG